MDGAVGRTNRSNDEWLAALRDPAEADAVTELRSRLRGGLARSLGDRRDVDDADLDDFAQDATVRVLSRLDSFRGDSRFTTWATAVAIRVAYTVMRRRHWGDRSLEDLGLGVDREAATPHAGAATPADPTTRGDLLSALKAAIDQDLTAHQRAAVLGELSGMPVPVLASQLSIKAGALYKLHHDARQRLKQSLQTRGFSEIDVRSIVERASQR